MDRAYLEPLAQNTTGHSRGEMISIEKPEGTTILSITQTAIGGVDQ